MDYKTIFIVDPVKSDRLQLAKFIKQENFTIVVFTNIADCVKRSALLKADLVIYVLRKGKSELKPLLNRAEDKAVPYILVVTPEIPEVNLEELREQGYAAVHKAGNPEKVREITYGLLAPDGLQPRTEKPHPIPIPFIKVPGPGPVPVPDLSPGEGPRPGAAPSQGAGSSP